MNAADGGEGYNYGVVKNTTGEIFYKKVNNYGIVILEKTKM